MPPWRTRMPVAAPGAGLAWRRSVGSLRAVNPAAMTLAKLTLNSTQGLGSMAREGGPSTDLFTLERRGVAGGGSTPWR